jgi:predicted Zn-dependent protease
MKKVFLLAVGCGLVASCNEISGPIRPPAYGYSLPVSDVVQQDTTIDGVEYFAGDTITDTLDFAWPHSALPIKIWVHDTLDLPHDVQLAIAAWKNVLVYGEVGATIVGDSLDADIIMRGGAPPPTAAPAGTRLFSFSSVPAACEGRTDVYISAPDHTKLWTPIRVYLTPKFLPDLPLTKDCLARVTIHELGHALGLFRHSPDPEDIMYSFPDTSVHAPSEGDAATILQLYHQQSDLRPAVGRDTLPDSLPASPTRR